MRTHRFFPLPLLLLITAAPVAAYRTGGPLDLPVEAISKLMTVPVLRSELVQIGFIRFGIWLLVFTLGFWVFQRLFDRKTAGIISATISFIGALFMPKEWVVAQGGLMTALVASVLILSLVIGGMYGIWKLSRHESFILRLAAVALCFILMYIIGILEWRTGSKAIAPLFMLLPRTFLHNMTPRAWRKD